MNEKTATVLVITARIVLVIACVVTYLFSQLLQRMLARKVQKIDMVEALKSVE